MKQFLALIFIAYSVSAWATPKEIILVAPPCFLNATIPYRVLSSTKNLQLIKTEYLAELQQLNLRKPFSCQKFMNVTADWQDASIESKQDVMSFFKKNLPTHHPNYFSRFYRIKYKPQVEKIFHFIDPVSIRDNFITLKQFPDRYVNSNNGLHAAQWLEKRLKNMMELSIRKDIAVFTIPTLNGMKQPSVIIKIGNTTLPAIVLGAHLDTLNIFPKLKTRVNNDASGSVVLLETAKILINTDIPLKKPIYLIWYAGEEEGKLGSQNVVRYFAQNHIAVDSVLELDKGGIINKEERSVGLIDDYTDSQLTAFVADLVAGYLKLPVNAMRCGYACSDHYTWYQHGYRVAYPFESMREEAVPIKQMINLVKLALAFSVEMAEMA